MRCKDFKPFRKNTLRGFFTLELKGGLDIRDCTLHEDSGKAWFGFPGVPYQDKTSGQTKYKNIIYIADTSILNKMRDQVIEELKEHLDGGIKQPPSKFEDAPF